ncbi:MAG: winged helix-turn-helix transcriptional regulator [Candidatus Kerfeldbacteria bacterium]|nr:winged helix-turn-helix transcriptional regulator [Candidatus Kerfeldbacteria bacterium]
MKITELEKSCRLLSARKRIEIMELLLNGRSKSVGDVAAAIHLSFKSTSKHLIMLRQGGFLERYQNRYSGLYQLNDDLPFHLKSLLKLIRQLT